MIKSINTLSRVYLDRLILFSNSFNVHSITILNMAIWDISIMRHNCMWNVKSRFLRWVPADFSSFYEFLICVWLKDILQFMIPLKLQVALDRKHLPIWYNRRIAIIETNLLVYSQSNLQKYQRWVRNHCLSIIILKTTWINYNNKLEHANGSVLKYISKTNYILKSSHKVEDIFTIWLISY